MSFYYFFFVLLFYIVFCLYGFSLAVEMINYIPDVGRMPPNASSTNWAGIRMTLVEDDLATISVRENSNARFTPGTIVVARKDGTPPYFLDALPTAPDHRSDIVGRHGDLEGGGSAISTWRCCGVGII